MSRHASSISQRDACLCSRQRVDLRVRHMSDLARSPLLPVASPERHTPKRRRFAVDEDGQEQRRRSNGPLSPASAVRDVCKDRRQRGLVMPLGQTRLYMVYCEDDVTGAGWHWELVAMVPGGCPPDLTPHGVPPSADWVMQNSVSTEMLEQLAHGVGDEVVALDVRQRRHGRPPRHGRGSGVSTPRARAEPSLLAAREQPED